MAFTCELDERARPLWYMSSTSDTMKFGDDVVIREQRDSLHTERHEQKFPTNNSIVVQLPAWVKDYMVSKQFFKDALPFITNKNKAKVRLEGCTLENVLLGLQKSHSLHWVVMSILQHASRVSIEMDSAACAPDTTTTYLDLFARVQKLSMTAVNPAIWVKQPLSFGRIINQEDAEISHELFDLADLAYVNDRNCAFVYRVQRPCIESYLARDRTHQYLQELNCLFDARFRDCSIKYYFKLLYCHDEKIEEEVSARFQEHA